MCRRLTALLLGLLLGMATLLPVRAGDAADENWLVVRDREFTVYTNGRPRVADMVTRNLRAVHEVILGLNPALQPRFEVPTWVLAFNTYESWIPYQTDRNGKSEGAAGMFIDHQLANILALVADPNYDPYPVLYHEYTHYLLSTVFPDLPPWLDEGLAEYFGSMWIFPDRVEVGSKIKWHMAELRNASWLPLDRLLAVTLQDDEYHEESRRGMFYAQSWALVHYLMQSNPTDLDAVARYVRLVEQGEERRKALATAFGEDLTGLEARLRAYVKNSKFKPTRLQDLPSLSSGSIPSSPAPRAELLTRLGMYLVIADLGARGQPERLFQAALAAEKDYPPARTGLGLFHDSHDRPDEAAVEYRRALATDPDHEPACLLLARVHLQRHLEDQGDPAGSDEDTTTAGTPAVLHPDLAEARVLLQHAMELNPLRPETVVAFGYTYIGDPGDLTPGIRALEKGRTLFPRRLDLTMNLGILYLRQGEPEAARTLFRQLRDNHPTQESGRRAENALILMSVDDAKALLSQGDFDQGLARLRTLRDRTDDTQIWAYINSIIAAGEAGEKEYAIVTDLNESSRLAAEGRLDEAGEHLESARSRSDNPEMGAAVQDQIHVMEDIQHLQEELDKASALLQEGKLEEGATILRRIRAVSDREDLNKMIDDQLAQIDLIHLEDQQVDLFNQAREMIAAGQFDEAASRLRSIVQDPANPRLAEAAQDLLQTLKEHMDR
jgi:tetratricopeptide (TPR) repeat protein